MVDPIFAISWKFWNKYFFLQVTTYFYSCFESSFESVLLTENFSGRTRGDVSYEFFFQSGDMSNLAYIGTKNLNFWPITGFVYLP